MELTSRGTASNPSSTAGTVADVTLGGLLSFLIFTRIMKLKKIG